MPILKHIDFEVPGFGELSTPPIDVPHYADAVVAMSPLAYWRLDELAGTELADAMGSQPLTLSGSYALGQAGALRRADSAAIHFTGGSASSTGPVLPTAADAPLSLAFWVRRPPGVVDSGAFIGQYTADSTGHARVILTSGDANLRFVFSGGENVKTISSIGEAWCFAVLTRSATGTLRWFIDGQLDIEKIEATPALAAVPFQLGQVVSNPGQVFLDHVAVFDRELLSEEVRWLHGLGTASLALPPAT
jgi:hypothetical protein